MFLTMRLDVLMLWTFRKYDKKSPMSCDDDDSDNDTFALNDYILYIRIG